MEGAVGRPLDPPLMDLVRADEGEAEPLPVLLLLRGERADARVDRAVEAHVVGDPPLGARVGPLVVVVRIAEVEVGVEADDPDVLREPADGGGRDAVLPPDREGDLPRLRDPRRGLGDPLHHRLRRPEVLQVPEVVELHVEDVPPVVHHVRLEVVRRLSDRVRGPPGPEAERGRPVEGHAEQDDASVVVGRDRVRERAGDHGGAANRLGP